MRRISSSHKSEDVKEHAMSRKRNQGLNLPGMSEAQRRLFGGSQQRGGGRSRGGRDQFDLSTPDKSTEKDGTTHETFINNEEGYRYSADFDEHGNYIHGSGHISSNKHGRGRKKWTDPD
jgi:hypothetical protein